MERFFTSLQIIFYKYAWWRSNGFIYSTTNWTSPNWLHSETISVGSKSSRNENEEKTCSSHFRLSSLFLVYWLTINQFIQIATSQTNVYTRRIGYPKNTAECISVDLLHPEQSIRLLYIELSISSLPKHQLKLMSPKLTGALADHRMCCW